MGIILHLLRSFPNNSQHYWLIEGKKDTTKSPLTCCTMFKHLPGHLRERVLQLLNEEVLFSICAEHHADLLHQLHRPGHVEAVLLTDLRKKPKAGKGKTH